MRVSFVLFNVHEKGSKKLKTSPCRLYVHVIKSRTERFNFKSPFKILPKEWNSDKQEPRYTCENNITISNYIASTKSSLMKIIAENSTKTFDSIKIEIQKFNGIHTGPSVKDVFDEYIRAQSIIKSSKSVAKYKSIEPYLMHDSFDKYDLKFLDKFIKTLLDAGKLNSTINKKLEMMRNFFKWSEQRGYHKNAHIFNSEAHRFPRSDNNEVIALTAVECQLIAELELTNITDDHIRNMFLLSCYSGSRISDLRSLDENQLSDDAWEFEAWKTRKNKVQIKIPFLAWPAGAKIYSRKVLDNGMYVSEKHMNERIKVIAEMAGITETIRKTRMSGPKQVVWEKPKYEFISIHSGRKTFVSVLLNMGVPDGIVMKLSGISNYKTLKRYHDTQESDVLRALEKLDKV